MKTSAAASSLTALGEPVSITASVRALFICLQVEGTEASGSAAAQSVAVNLGGQMQHEKLDRLTHRVASLDEQIASLQGELEKAGQLRDSLVCHRHARCAIYLPAGIPAWPCSFSLASP